MWKKTSVPEKEQWLPTSSAGRSIQKGDAFWCRCKKAIYGAIVLDIQGGLYYFIALTHELHGIPQNIEEIVSASFYTAAWFSDMDLLPITKLHHIGKIQIADDYNGRAGFSLLNCCRFSTEDDKGCSYMYSCAQIDPNTTNLRIFDRHQAVIFLGNESNYRDVISMIPKLKSMESIENYIIQSGKIVIRSEDTRDVGYYLWFVSNEKNMQAIRVKIQQNSMMELHGVF